MQKRSSYLFLFFILLLTFLLFYPGLHGTFLLDDFANLPPLNTINQSEQFIDSIWQFISQGASSKIGRPVSLLSFALQSNSWPETPGQFKIVNLIIHLINGVLIFFIARKLITLHNKIDHNSILILSLLITFIWLIHPLQISTVQYIIQRMVLLSSLFMLIGISSYLYIRTSLKPEKQLKWLTLWTGFSLLMGILSKENAILLCPLLLLLEFTILKDSATPKYFKYWILIFILLPLIALVVYLIPHVSPYMNTTYPGRNFSAWERLLTQFRVLANYIYIFFAPSPGSLGLFHSDFNPSRGLFQPVTTFISLLFLVALLLFSYILRHKNILIFIGIAWFFIAHMLESTVLNLELYFEHRNYLAIFGLSLSLVMISYEFFIFLKNRYQPSINKMLIVIAILYLLFLSILNYSENQLWGNPLKQSIAWANEHPNSYRAQGQYLSLLRQLEEFDLVARRLEELSYHFKKDITFPLQRLELVCYGKSINNNFKELIIKRSRSARYFNETIIQLYSILKAQQTGQCINIDPKFLISIIQTLKSNKQYFPLKKMELKLLLSSAYSLQGNYSDAINELESIQKKPRPINVLISLLNMYSITNNDIKLTRTIQETKSYCSLSPENCLQYKNQLKSYGINL